jgi:type II secretory pathway pseudopilin PulG
MRATKSKSAENKERGFSLIELLVAMGTTLLLLGLVTTLFSRAMGSRSRESRKADALVSARAALNQLSREVANSGYGLTNNGIVLADSTSQRIHFRANLANANYTTNDPGEDVTYFYDSDTQSIVRYSPTESPTTAVVVNKISNVTFSYINYSASSSTPTISSVPTDGTGRVQITVTVQLDAIYGQINPQAVSFTSDVTIRNSTYMLNQY